MSKGKSLQTDRKWILKICKGQEDAADFLIDFFLICHLWDDLIDKDVDRSEEEINYCFWLAMVDLPMNRYYQHYFTEIHPLIANAIQEWFASNKLEKSQRTDIAYTLRCSIVSLIHQAAYLCGGYKWACEVGEEIRLRTQDETMKEYLENL